MTLLKVSLDSLFVKYLSLFQIISTAILILLLPDKTLSKDALTDLSLSVVYLLRNKRLVFFSSSPATLITSSLTSHLKQKKSRNKEIAKQKKKKKKKKKKSINTQFENKKKKKKQWKKTSGNCRAEKTRVFKNLHLIFQELSYFQTAATCW